MSGPVTACGICGSTDLTVILDMGSQPLAERFGDPRTYPLALAQCGDCTLVQLTYAVDQGIVFPPDHPYASGNTRALLEHFIGLAGRLARHLSDGDLAADIGSNDGTLLSLIRPGVRKVGVEPTNQVRKYGREIDCYQEFFTADLGAEIAGAHGPAKVVTATNVLAHVADVHDVMKGINSLLADDGILVTENHDLASVTDGLQVDTVYHEHLRYFSLTSLARLLGMHGLTVTETERIPAHGGSTRVFARKLRTGGLQDRAQAAATALQVMLADITGHGDVVYGVGAATRATPLIHFAQIAKYLTCVCEVPGSEKIGRLMPGTNISVVDEVRLLEDQPPYALLFAWPWADTLTRKLRAADYRGKFIVPLPEPRVLDA